MWNIGLCEALAVLFVLCSLDLLWKPRSTVCLESPSDKEVPGKPILGPLPQKSCATKIELCFDGPFSTALSLHPHTDPREGRVEGMRRLSLGPHEIAWQSSQGGAQVARTWSACGATPTAWQSWAKWIPPGRDSPDAAPGRKIQAEEMWWLIKPTTVSRPVPFYVKKKKGKKKYVCLFFLCTELNI